jgi:NADH:ubiquinone oxidoreductase subunit B-like Fe-S oxidoreductase
MAAAIMTADMTFDVFSWQQHVRENSFDWARVSISCCTVDFIARNLAGDLQKERGEADQKPENVFRVA